MQNPNGRSKRGRKPILTPAQKRTLVRMVRQAFKAELRRWGKKGCGAGAANRALRLATGNRYAITPTHTASKALFS
jgi:hypothetical protein